jgi:hypothetical protein
MITKALRMSKLILLALGLVLTVALMAGCGGGGGGGGGGATLTGRVIDGSTSNPLSGVRVALGSANTTTPADGTFTLAGAPLGTGVITAQLTGYEISSRTIIVLAGTNPLEGGDILMAPTSGNPPGQTPRTIQGTISLSDASNPSGTVVVLLSAGSEVDRMTTGSDGAYSFWQPVGDYTVRASKTGFVTQDQSVSVTDLNQVVTKNLTLVKS